MNKQKMIIKILTITDNNKNIVVKINNVLIL